MRPSKQSASGPVSSVPKISFEKYTLSNGLQVILHVDRKLPIVHVNEWFHVGSKNERIGRTGFAHLFEHMMFQGSKNVTKEYYQCAEQAGANLFEGGVNGTTNWDRTNYFATVSSANLEYVLWLEADRVATLTDAMTQEKLDGQFEVVKNERRQSLENQPYGRAFKLIFENLYPYRHPYCNDVMGNMEDLAAASLDDIKDFFETYYTPNNLSLVVAGDFDPAEAKPLIEKYFGTLPTGPSLDQPPKWLPKLEGERTVEVNDRVPQERTYFTWPTPAYFDQGDAELELVAVILTGGLSSRLNKTLVYDKQLCSEVEALQFGRELGSNFIIWATARPDAQLEQIEQIVTDEIARLAREGPTAMELDRAKTKWEFGYITGLERIGSFGGKADLLNQYNTFLGDPNKFEADVERHRNTTIESVRDAVARYLDTRSRLLVRFRVETSGRESQVEFDRSKEPPLGADRPFNAPEVKSAKLENGMEILLVERNDLPKLAVTLATRAGNAADPAGKEGLADMTVAMMKRGTKTKDALEIEEALGDLGASVTGTAGCEHASLSFEVLKRNLTPALTILADIVREPAFSDTEAEREREQRLDTLAQESQDATAIAVRVGTMLIFGADHPYGRPAQGLPQTIERITRDDLAWFYETYWKPGSSVLIFVGDITLDEATELANQHFSLWSGGAAPSIQIPAPRPTGPGKVYLVDRQDAAQTFVAQILPAPPRESDDYYAMSLADMVWGGGFSTRLNMNLREDKGYSYGAYSYPLFYSKAGAWSSQAGIQTDKTKEALVEFDKELRFLAGEKPISDEELLEAKAKRIRGYAQQFESLSQIAGQIAALWVYGLPMTEMQREPTQLDKTTLDAVNAVASKYAAPVTATTLLVGDLSEIEAGVRELDLGEVIVLDVEGNPVKV